MNGLAIVNALPVWLLAALVVGACILFSVGLQLVARWRFGIERLAMNHDVAGFKYAVVGVAYAVLLAFVVVSVWDDLDRTKHTVQAEAERFYNLYRNSYNFPDPTGAKMRAALIDYATAVRDDDWPLMQRGLRGSKAATAAYNRLSLTVGQTKPEDVALLPSVTHAINLMQQIADLRLERLSSVGGRITPPIWAVLVLGAVITLAYPAFFATKDIAAQVLMTAGLAAIVGMILFLTINLNFPFSGPDRLTPAPIDRVIQHMTAGGG